MPPFRLAGRPLAVLAALALCLLSACQREQDAAPAVSQPLSIEEARSWFDSHLGNAPPAAPGGRTAKKPVREPDWAYAYQQKVKDKELVVVPLKLEKGHRSKGYLGKLLMSKDAQGNVQTQVVKASGTKAFLEKNNYNVHGEGFSGIVRVEDWDGKLIDGEYYDNGKVVGRLVERTDKGGRTQGYYITVIVSYYQQVCMGSDCGGWTYLDSQVKTIYVADGYTASNYYGTFYYSSGGGTGTGGSTSPCPYGPNCNEPVPFDEQTFDIEVVEAAAIANAPASGPMIGNRPFASYATRCPGIQAMWNNYPNNEVRGFLTRDGGVILTDVLGYSGGDVSALYLFNGASYFVYPASQGAPAINHSGTQLVNGNYYIPVVASIHTHTPCRTDGTNGVSGPVGDQDKEFARVSGSINHWVIGCGVIAQYNGSSTNFYNVQTGALSTLCSNIY